VPITAWAAHLYTATGIVIAFFATILTFDAAYRHVFLLLVLATAVDATDGFLARAARVKQRLPKIDGALMDNLIDYLTYAFIPALVVWHANLAAWPHAVCAAMLVSSLYGFSHADAKVERGSDHFFTGFPSYWNIVVVYLYIAQLSPVVNAIVLLTFVVLVFVPIRYLYPSRTSTLQRPTMVLGTIWAIVFAWMVWRLPATDGPWMLLSLVYPVYYIALSVWLHAGSALASPSR
jgi:phosphatidylcholine synthase